MWGVPTDYKIQHFAEILTKNESNYTCRLFIDGILFGEQTVDIETLRNGLQNFS